ncbi:MAG: cell division protein FtsZ [Pseudomonadota bacterium]
MLTLVNDEVISAVTDSILSFEKDPSQEVKIKIIGMGGCGGNAVNTMMLENLEQVDLMVANTAVNDLNYSNAPCKIQIGEITTKGFGAGADPEVGLRAAEESKAVLTQHIQGADLLFITAGMGGGTGTYSSSTVAEIAKSMNIPTISVVSMPSEDEGPKIARYAQDGLKKLRQFSNCTVVVSNEKIFKNVDENLEHEEILRIGDQVLCGTMKSVLNIIFSVGVNNVDFSDLMRFLSIGKQFCIGTARARGEQRGSDAVKLALNNPFVDLPENMSALGIICCIKGARVTGKDRRLVSEYIAAYMTSETLCPIGITKDISMPEDELEVTILIAGKENEHHHDQPPYVEINSPTHKPSPLQQRQPGSMANGLGAVPVLNNTVNAGTAGNAGNASSGRAAFLTRPGLSGEIASANNGSGFRSPRQYPAPNITNYDTPVFLKQAD